MLHGPHYLKDDGAMAIILPHGVLIRGGAEERIRTKLPKDGHIDTVNQRVEIDATIRAATAKHNEDVKELGLPPVP